MREYRDTAHEMLQFIEASPTAFHTVANAASMLEAEGFSRLEEGGFWKLSRGGKYYVVRNDSALIAFRIPESAEGRTGEEKIKGFHITATHGDAPCFKIKEKPQMTAEGKYLKLNTEKYGGMILSTWLDRALSVAGRVVYRVDGRISTRLVNVERDLLVIPNLAIHMGREMNKGVEYNPQVDMLPLFGCAGEDSAGRDLLMEEIAGILGVDPTDILGHDLYLYPREKGRILGAGEELILSPRLDDLQGTYVSLRAFLDSVPCEYINICAIFDNEEVGSGTNQGADSTFLEDVLYRIRKHLGAGREQYLRWIAESFLISLDNAHAVHPNRPEKADPTNRPYLNGGVVIKYQGSQKYTTDGVTGAVMKDICEQAGVPWQTYTNRSDVAGGSTLGNISTAHVSVPSVDIGLPQLAMHSAVETGGVKDTLYGIRALCQFWKQ